MTADDSRARKVEWASSRLETTCEQCGTTIHSVRFYYSDRHMQGIWYLTCTVCGMITPQALPFDPTTTYRADDASNVNIDNDFTLGPGSTGRFLRSDEEE